MADFVKKTWVCDDTITADDLNRLEGGVEEALSKDCDKGYSCTEGWVTLTDESVTTAQSADAPEGLYGGAFAYSTPIDADTIKVTFNGVEYTCDKVLVGGEFVAYGGVGEQEPDFSEYPFVINSDNGENLIFTETAGTYRIKIGTFNEAVETSECFKKAVAEATKPLVLNIDNDTLDKTFEEIRDAYLSGRTVLLDPVNQTPILRDVVRKSYYSITEMMVVSGAGGTLAFGADVIQRFSASADDEYPTLVSN